jgi:hypothetical protein
MDVSTFVKDRDNALSGLPRGARYPTLASRLAKFGIEQGVVALLATQSATTADLRITQVPSAICKVADLVPPSTLITGQVQSVHVEIEQ